MGSAAVRGLLRVLAVAIPLGIGPGTRADEPPSGDEIMRRVDASPRGRDLSARAIWRLRNANGSERLRETRFFRLEAGDDAEVASRWLLVFDAPADVKATALLVWSPRDRTQEARQWIYLTSYRKVKRIAAGSRGNAFMGTEFSFEDLSERPVDDDSHTLLRVEGSDAAVRYVVESVPRDRDAPFSRRIQWVDPGSWTVDRIDYFDADGELDKTLTSEWSSSSSGSCEPPPSRSSSPD